MRRGLFAVALLAGCKEPPPACTSVAVDLACQTQYVPTFDNVYNNTMTNFCGTRDGSCHSASGDSGISFADRDVAYENLMNGRVTPGDPTCSELIVRTIESGADYSMPPKKPLSDNDRCALVKWVAAGAPAPGEPFPMQGAPR